MIGSALCGLATFAKSGALALVDEQRPGDQDVDESARFAASRDWSPHARRKNDEVHTPLFRREIMSFPQVTMRRPLQNLDGKGVISKSR